MLWGQSCPPGAAKYCALCIDFFKFLSYLLMEVSTGIFLWHFSFPHVFMCWKNEWLDLMRGAELPQKSPLTVVGIMC